MDFYDPESGEVTKPKRRISAIAIFTWGLLACIVVAFIAPLAGLRIKPASEVLNSQRADESAVPTLQSGEPLTEMWVNVWFLPERTYMTADQLGAQSVTRGITADGKLAYHIAFSDAGFNEYLSYWFHQLVQSQFPELDQPLIDVEPGRLLAWIEMPWGDTRNRICMVYELDDSGTQFDFKGILVGSQFWTTSEGSFFDEHGAFVESLANRAIQELVMIDASGAELSIQQISFTHDHIDILAVAK
jgi:hypothetical protein